MLYVVFSFVFIKYVNDRFLLNLVDRSTLGLISYLEALPAQPPRSGDSFAAGGRSLVCGCKGISNTQYQPNPNKKKSKTLPSELHTLPPK